MWSHITSHMHPNPSSTVKSSRSSLTCLISHRVVQILCATKTTGRWIWRFRGVVWTRSLTDLTEFPERPMTLMRFCSRQTVAPPFPDGFNAQPAPYGVTFSGRAFSEPRLIGLAYAFEQATKHRRPPFSVP